MFKDTQYYDKIEVVENTLKDVICNFFAGNSRVTLTNNARAVSEIVRKIGRFFVAQGVIDEIAFASDHFSDNVYLKAMNTRINMRSNFAKHADSNPMKSTDYSEVDAQMAIRSACIDFKNLIGPLVDQDVVDVVCDEDCLEKFDVLTPLDALIDIFDRWFKEQRDDTDSKDEIYKFIRKHKLYMHTSESSYAFFESSPVQRGKDEPDIQELIRDLD